MQENNLDTYQDVGKKSSVSVTIVTIDSQQDLLL